MLLKSLHRIQDFLKFSIDISSATMYYTGEWAITMLQQAIKMKENVELGNAVPEDVIPKKDIPEYTAPLWTPEDICARAWIQICLSPNKEMARNSFQVISALQYDIADDYDDPRWKVFLDSLPGFRDYLTKISKES